MSKAWAAYKKDNMVNVGKHYLRRQYIRKETMDAINVNTKYNTKGQVYDSIGKKWVDVDKVELGHRSSHEFWFERNRCEALGMTQAEFNEYMNNPEFYAWKDIHDNRSHALEDKH